MSRPLTLALPKGRLLDPALALLASMGVQGLDADSRRLLLTDERMDLRFILLKPPPSRLRRAAPPTSASSAGHPARQEPDLYEPGTSASVCRLVVAEPGVWERDDPRSGRVRVAKDRVRRYLGRGNPGRIVRLNGHRSGDAGGLAERIAI